MAHIVVDADEIELTWGTHRRVRHALGGTSFGLNQVDFPPGKVGPEHDELESGHEEVYYCLSGGGSMTVDGEQIEMLPGRYILVSPRSKRQCIAGAEGMSFICIGGVPGIEFRD